MNSWVTLRLDPSHWGLSPVRGQCSPAPRTPAAGPCGFSVMMLKVGVDTI